MTTAGSEGAERTTEQDLLDAAIELYGKFGTQGVSLNQIRKHASVANEAAIRYYFRNKQGLLARSLDQVAQKLVPTLAQAVQRLEEQTPSASVNDILMSFGLPFLGMHSSDPNSMNLIGSLMREEGEFGQKLLASSFGEIVVRFELLLARAMPYKPLPMIHLHFQLAINLLIHGLGDIDMLRHMPAPSDEAKSVVDDPAALVAGFLEYVRAGLEGVPGAVGR